MAHNLSSISKTYQRDAKAAVTMFMIIGSCVVCWMPFVTCVLLEKTKYKLSGTEYHKIIIAFSLCATHFNAAIDPMIYAYRNREIRQAIKKVLRCGKYSVDKINTNSSLELRSTLGR